MQERRFLFDLIILAGFIVFVIPGSLIGQSSKELSDLYENQQFLKLKEYYENNQIHDPGWKRFVEALSEDNADSAIIMFAGVYKSAFSDRLGPR